jgi:hypothetical protein
MKPFSEQTLQKAWQRAGGCCEAPECRRRLHWDHHGLLHLPQGWLGLQRVALPGRALDIPANCQIICRDCRQSFLDKCLVLSSE